MSTANEFPLARLPFELVTNIYSFLSPYDVFDTARSNRQAYDHLKPLLAAHKAGFAQFDRRRQIIDEDIDGENQLYYENLRRALLDPEPFFYAKELVVTSFSSETVTMPHSQQQPAESSVAEIKELFKAGSCRGWLPTLSSLQSRGVLESARITEQDYLDDLFTPWRISTVTSFLLTQMSNVNLLRIAAYLPLSQVVLSSLPFLRYLTVLEVPAFAQYRGESEPISPEGNLLNVPRHIPSLKVLRTRAVHSGQSLDAESEILDVNRLSSYLAHPLPITTFQINQGLIPEDAFDLILSPMKSLKRFELSIYTWEALLEWRDPPDILAPLRGLKMHCMETLEFLALTFSHDALDSDMSEVRRKSRGLSIEEGRTFGCFPNLTTLIVDSFYFTEPSNEGASDKDDTNSTLVEDLAEDKPQRIIDFLPKSLETLVVHVAEFDASDDFTDRQLVKLFEGLEQPKSPQTENERTQRLPNLRTLLVVPYKRLSAEHFRNCRASFTACGADICKPEDRPECSFGPPGEFVDEQSTYKWEHDLPDTLNWPPGYYTL